MARPGGRAGEDGGDLTPIKAWKAGRTSMMEALLTPEVPLLPTRLALEPGTHRLPAALMWSVTMLTAVGMAIINFGSLLAIEFTIQCKFSWMQSVIDSSGLGMGLVVLALVSAGYAATGACLVLFLAPNCGGSGLPECKCYLNGSDIPRFFTVKNLLVRIMTSFLANAAGFPIGREGPTVTIGTNLAFLISYGLTMPRLRQYIELAPDLSTLIVEEERFQHATRINCAVGGACAMAMLFNTPIGGLLYMFEEMSPVSWPVELTFRAFVGTTCCALLSYGLLSAVNKEIRDFVIFAWLPDNKEWSSADLPLFVLLAAALGAVTAYHTRMMLAVSRMRKGFHGRLRWTGVGIALETTLYASFCALLSGVVSLAATCQESNSELPYVRFNCKEGEYNPVASLLVTTSHSSVKLLFSGNNNGEIGWQSTTGAFATYFLLNVGLAGLPVPGGAFTATMLLGGLCGRAVGALAHQLGLNAAVSGVYAVVGAAAMLCGFKQMAAAVVLIVVQCVNDFNITPVVMLSVSIALTVNRAINERGHDEEQIERKNLPFLEAEAPRRLDESVALDLVDDLPVEALLSRRSSIRQVEWALKATEEYGANKRTLTDFPVLDKDYCVGVLTRGHLEAALKAQRRVENNPKGAEGSEEISPGVRRSQQMAMQRVNSRLGSRDGSSPVDDHILPLDRIMDPTPFSVVEDMPASRFYGLFAKAGERACCVTTRTGEFKGLISRTGLIEFARR